MLNHVNLEILKRARPPHSTFNFSSASVGNLFLTGARLFTGSFESAIYLLALVCGIPERTAVLPAINSNFSHHISAGLESGEVITGQNAISHPSAPTALPDGQADLVQDKNTPSGGTSGRSVTDPVGEALPHDDPHPEDANLPGSLPTLRTPNIVFSKTSAPEDDLPSPIKRVWYINPYGHEISPFANPKAVGALRGAEAVVYSIGSLYTSVVPCLVLRGIGEALAGSGSARIKILILNGSVDRETGPRQRPMGASAFVAAIARAGEESQGWRAAEVGKGSPEVDRMRWRRYVTHVIYLEGEGAPKSDKNELSAAGIERVRCWGKRGDDGSWRYDPKGLVGALEAILGRGRDGERSRRNTLER